MVAIESKLHGTQLALLTTLCCLLDLGPSMQQEGKAGAPESLAKRRGYSLNVDDACIINRTPSSKTDDCASPRLGPPGTTVRRLTSMCERIVAGGHAKSIEAVKQYQQNEVMAVITDVRSSSRHVLPASVSGRIWEQNAL